MVKYCVLILSYKRPDNVATYATLRKSGYSGPIYIVVGDDDPTIEQYRSKYGEHVVAFSKADYIDQSDLCDNRKTELGTVLFARNACPDIVRKLGFTHWIELDDDYSSFVWKVRDGIYIQKAMGALDDVFSAVWEMREYSGWDMVALSQGGDFIGGKECQDNKIQPKRKVMNSFFCSLDRHSAFIGRMNDDVNTYTHYGNKGKKFITIRAASLNQRDTQQNEGGLSAMYLRHGTYVKSFYTVMLCPSFVQVKPMHSEHTRWHHSIKWDHAVPKIIAESYKKES